MERLNCKSTKEQEYRECAKHGKYMAYGSLLQMLHIQKMNWTECPRCVQEEDEANAKAAAEKTVALEKAKWDALLGRSCLPRRFIEKTFDNYQCPTQSQKNALAHAKRYAENFPIHADRGEGLIFMGGVGTGKSHLAAAIMQAVMPNYLGIYTTVSGLIHTIRNAWHPESRETELQVVNRFIKADLLVLDEVGIQRETQSEFMHLFDVLDGRYREMMPTIFIGNVNKEELKKFMTERIYDRMVETNTAIVFDWASYRSTQAQKRVNLKLVEGVA